MVEVIYEEIWEKENISMNFGRYLWIEDKRKGNYSLLNS